jgi:hypothetical protein
MMMAGAMVAGVMVTGLTAAGLPGRDRVRICGAHGNSLPSSYRLVIR